MVEGTHVLKMIDYIKILQELAIDVVLQMFSDSYSQFIMNYNMNETQKSLLELLSMLRTIEANLKKLVLKVILMVRRGKGKSKKYCKDSTNGKSKCFKVTLEPKR